MREHPVIEARGWGWRHAGRRHWAVRGLDLVVNAGERVLLLGPSGAGKSTLLAALAGLLRAPESGDEEGRLLVGGVPAAEAPGHAGLVFQDPSSALVMGRVGDEVAFGLENRAVPAAEIWPRVGRALAAVGLSYPLTRSTEQLSGGEQQRLAIADVVAAAPRLWLLDEPTANLDPPGTALVRETLRAVLGRRDNTLVLVEHKVEPALELVERVVVLGAEGALVADGSPAEVFSSHAPALRAAGVWAPGPAPERLSPPRTGGDPVIRAEGVSVRYPGTEFPAVESADLAAYSGQVLALTGPNGSGKSSLALVLASLLAPSAGSVRFLSGGPPGPYTKWRARELVRWVGTVFQEPEHQFVASTVEDELLVGPRRAGASSAAARRRVTELMERLRLTALARANPFTLSGGEKRRLSVATALATEPALLVLDEPTFGQDASTWDELVALLAEQRDAGRAVICVTHDEQLVGALADREARMHAGRLTELAGTRANRSLAERPSGAAALG
ncbi:MAG: ATP-binding cassette domain-containing protein [Actinomycetota bacterium]|jgi:energy-coupling factor transport system ATP-binding protein|nr:ATP-binding cassette domain-containing protein [Actinomycetota bacterium]